jgi:hypothetical protein
MGENEKMVFFTFLELGVYRTTDREMADNQPRYMLVREHREHVQNAPCAFCVGAQNLLIPADQEAWSLSAVGFCVTHLTVGTPMTY